MKLVKEHIIFEKFVEDSDPIHDMGIGTKVLIEKWLKEMGISNYRINKDGTINITSKKGKHHIIYADLENSKQLPDYIQFNIVRGAFVIKGYGVESLKGCPKKIIGNKNTYGVFICRTPNLKTLDYCPIVVDKFRIFGARKKFTEEDVKNRCIVRLNDIEITSK